MPGWWRGLLGLSLATSPPQQAAPGWGPPWCWCGPSHGQPEVVSCHSHPILCEPGTRTAAAGYLGCRPWCSHTGPHCPWCCTGAPGRPAVIGSGWSGSGLRNRRSWGTCAHVGWSPPGPPGVRLPSSTPPPCAPWSSQHTGASCTCAWCSSPRLHSTAGPAPGPRGQWPRWPRVAAHPWWSCHWSVPSHTPPSWHCTVHLTQPHMLLLSRFSRVRLCAASWTSAYQASPFMAFSWQEDWSGLPLPSPQPHLGGCNGRWWQAASPP